MRSRRRIHISSPVDGLEREVPSVVATHAGRPFQLASRTGRPRASSAARSPAYGDWSFRTGRGMQQAEMRPRVCARTVAALVASSTGGRRDLFARQLVWSSDLDSARSCSCRALRRARDTGRRRRRRDRTGGWPSRVAGRSTGTAAERYAAELRSSSGRSSDGAMPEDVFPSRSSRRTAAESTKRGAAARSATWRTGGDGHRVSVRAPPDPRLARALARRRGAALVGSSRRSKTG